MRTRLLLMALYLSNSVLAQHDPAAFGDPASPDAAAADMARQQAALQFTEQINTINNEFGNQIGSLQTQIASQNVQKTQCEIDYTQAISEAESQAQEQKSGAMQGMIGQAMGPTIQALSGLLNKEDEKQVENFAAQAKSFNAQVDAKFSEHGINAGTGAGFHQSESGELNSANFVQFQSSCNKHLLEGDQRAGQIKFETCKQDLQALENMKNNLNNLATQYNVDKNASSDTAGKILQAAIPIGMGLFGYSTTKKGAEQGLESTKEAAAFARDQCLANADIALKDSKRQLASLENQKQQALSAARQAAGLANQALDAQLAQQRLQSQYGPDPTGVVVDPSTLPNKDGINPLLASGPTIGDPSVPTGGGKAPLGFAQNSGSDDKAQVGAGGGAGGGGGGGGGTPWTYGASYPGFPGGGGLPDQPDKAKFAGTGGGSGVGGVGGFGEFASAQDAFNSFAQWGRGQSEARGLASNGDGGLLVLLQRARLRLSAHAAELLTSNHTDLLARKDSKQNQANVPATPKEPQRTTASRLR